jgi:hypothetical protein
MNIETNGNFANLTTDPLLVLGFSFITDVSAFDHPQVE